MENKALQIYFPASRALDGFVGTVCTCLDLERYDHGVEGLDWFLLVLVGSGAAMCASSGLGQLLRTQAYDLLSVALLLLVMIAFFDASLDQHLR